MYDFQSENISSYILEHYYGVDGMLYYSAIGTRKALKNPSLLDNERRVVVRTCEEERIIVSCHSSPHGEFIN